MVLYIAQQNKAGDIPGRLALLAGTMFRIFHGLFLAPRIFRQEAGLRGAGALRVALLYQRRDSGSDYVNLSYGNVCASPYLPTRR